MSWLNARRHRGDKLTRPADHQQPCRSGRGRHALLGNGGRFLGLVASLFLLAGCQVLDARSPDRHTIEMQGQNRFLPGTIEVDRGATVVWHNQDQIWHTTTTEPVQADAAEQISLPAEAAAWDSGNVDPGATWAIKLDEPGTYLYYCRRHADQGMIGSITVRE